MPAMQAQQAPEQGKRQAKQRQSNHKAPQKKEGFRDKLQRLPLAGGIALMILCLAVSLPVGNFRALQSATPKAFLRQGDVKSIIEDRIDAAGNAMTVASRAGLDANAINAAEAAMQILEDAKTAQEISRADQELTRAVSELTTAALSGEEARNMLRAADDFAEQGSFLRQEARAYNEQAKKAEKLYDGLPMKFLFAEPDIYEGI